MLRGNLKGAFEGEYHNRHLFLLLRRHCFDFACQSRVIRITQPPQNYPRRARIQGSQTFSSHNSRLEGLLGPVSRVIQMRNRKITQQKRAIRIDQPKERFPETFPAETIQNSRIKEAPVKDETEGHGGNPHRGLHRDCLSDYVHFSVTVSVDPLLCPHEFSYCTVCGLSTSRLFKKSLCSPLCGRKQPGRNQAAIR